MHESRPGFQAAALLLVAAAITLLPGCGVGNSTNTLNFVPEASAADAVTWNYGFSPSSTVKQLNEDTWTIMAEAKFPNLNRGMGSYDLAFRLPPNRSVAAIQGTVSLRSKCWAQYLAAVIVDGAIYPMNAKIGSTGGGESLFVNYTVEIPYTNGDARLHVEADPICDDGSLPTTWEMQALLKIK